MLISLHLEMPGKARKREITVIVIYMCEVHMLDFKSRQKMHFLAALPICVTGIKEPKAKKWVHVK